jgi:hypothetical protein
MFARLGCFFHGHNYWVEGYGEKNYPRGTLFCIYCLKRAKKQPILAEHEALKSGEEVAG